MRFSQILLCLFMSTTAFADLTVYTDRPSAQMTPIAQEFQKRTGIKTVIVEMTYPALLQRLQTEGAQSPADVLYVKDSVYLADLTQKGMFAPMSSTVVNANIAPFMRDPQGHWTAITFRARTIAYAPDRVSPSELSTYEALSSPDWEGRLCMRTSQGTYNEALAASLILNLGQERALETVKGWVNNLSVPVYPNDTRALEAVANGICDVAIVNSYYLGALLAQKPNLPVKIFFANQGTTGTHLNGSGAGIAATSKQPSLAKQFIEHLLEDQSQLLLSGQHMDYPAKKGLLPSTLVREWGTFKADELNWSSIGNTSKQGRELLNAAGYL